jgi:type VI secretion system protein ImpF
MAELTTQDKLQPALLDRLTDDEPGNRTESREKRVMSMRQLRAAVLRDLAFLLNAPCRPDGDEIYEYPLVAKSVLNYGKPDLAGLSASGVTSDRLERMVHDAILAFEPRIMAAGLTIRAVDVTDGTGRQTLGIEISGELCPLPMPEAVFLRTTMDLETGEVDVKERMAR